MFSSNPSTSKIKQLRTFLHSITQHILTLAPSTLQQPQQIKLPFSFTPLYTLVYNLCNEKPSLQQKMLQQFKSCLVHFIEAYICQSQDGSFAFRLQNASKVIGWFNQLWKKYVRFLIVVSKKVFCYLDRFYLPGTQEESLYKVGMTVFKTKVLHQHNTQFFMNCYFAILRQLRHSKVIQSYELLHFSEAISIVDSKSLISQLTKRFIEQSCDYYNSFFRLNSSKLSPVQYLSAISNLHKFEFVLIKMTACLNFFEQAELSAHFESILVRNYTEQLVREKSRQGGLWELFEKKHIEGMRVVNQVYGRFQGFQKIKHAYYQILQQQSSKLPFNQSSIIPIYQFYKSHLSILTSGFSKRNQLLVTLNNAIQNIISRQQHFPTKLYQYCSLSRANHQFQKEREMITVLFEKISMKDQFIDRYEDELIKKISDATVNIDDEDQFVQWLNSICGNQLTHRLGKKIKDYRQAPKSIELGHMLPQNTLFNISVLSLHLWEKKFVDQLSLNISLPQTLQTVWSRVEKNFTSIQPKKKLTILPFSNKLTLNIRFNLKTYTIKCHLIQASVLIYLSSKAYSSQQQLIQSLMIEKNLLQSTLESLQSIPNLLIKTTLNDYLINWYFDHPQNTIDLISKTPQSKNISKAIQQDRQILLEAAIVKFMKRRKMGTFQDIANGVVSMIKLFKPLPPAIKATIQRLVKKSYLEEGENGVLIYSE